jgi:hypothetical protein
VIRRATRTDLPALVALLADDPLGAVRESGDSAAYERAFAAVDADDHQLLVCADEARRRGCRLVQLTTGRAPTPTAPAPCSAPSTPTAASGGT